MQKSRTGVISKSNTSYGFCASPCGSFSQCKMLESLSQIAVSCERHTGQRYSLTAPLLAAVRRSPVSPCVFFGPLSPRCLRLAALRCLCMRTHVFLLSVLQHANETLRYSGSPSKCGAIRRSDLQDHISTRIRCFREPVFLSVQSIFECIFSKSFAELGEKRSRWPTLEPTFHEREHETVLFCS